MDMRWECLVWDSEVTYGDFDTSFPSDQFWYISLFFCGHFAALSSGLRLIFRSVYDSKRCPVIHAKNPTARPTHWLAVSCSCAGTVYLTGRLYPDPRTTELNPFKGKRGHKNEEEWTDSSAYADKILGHVLYDAAGSAVLDHFAPIQENTECVFARTAKIWGAKPFIDTLSLGMHDFCTTSCADTESHPFLNLLYRGKCPEVSWCWYHRLHYYSTSDLLIDIFLLHDRSIPMFIKFINVGKSLRLDGFLFEIPHQEFGQSPESFGSGVRCLLKCLSDHDPAGRKCMDRSYIDKRGWYFEFDNESIFVTTFAPCYPSSHSRYGFGAQGCFVLFQPEFSFAAHDIGPDTPDTNWKAPSTVRDKIRVAYSNAGRPYVIRDTVYYPPVHDIVKPLGLDDPPIKWWTDK